MVSPDAMFKEMNDLKVLVIGGVAGGASAAARLRRLDESAEIIMFERGDYISFANCGLPYYIGGTIKERDKLLVQTPAGMSSRFNIDVRVNTEAMRIDCANKIVEVMDTRKGDTYTETYDYIVLSPGAEPVRPPIPGIDGQNIYSLRSLDDTDRIYHHLKQSKVSSVAIVGAGFIGLEMAENIHALGAEVIIVEASNQVMAPLDPEMAEIVHGHLRGKGVKLFLNQGVTSFADENGRKNLTLQNNTAIEADAVILAIGVKPESKLAAEAGLELGERRTVRVNEYLQTSDPHIYAVGDVIEVEDFVNGKKTYIPLAGPANRQGRIAADNIAGRKQPYRGTQGTSIAKVFDLVVATTGNNEKTLTRHGIPYEKSYTNSASHAGYYPGATPMNVKLIFDREGKILGVQVVGIKGVDKRTDVLATAIRAGLTVYDLEELELSYAPPFSSAKDPVNMAGFVAANILKGDMDIIHWHDIKSLDFGKNFLLDVRTVREYAGGHIEGAVNIPLHTLRDRINEIPQDKEIVVYCAIGLRAYVATRILMQNGFRVTNLSGGYNIYTLGKMSER